MGTPKLGTVWPVGARVFDAHGKQIGTCIDTPNGIAKAMMECPRIAAVKPFGQSIQARADYADRMKDWNQAQSCLTLKRQARRARKQATA